MRTDMHTHAYTRSHSPADELQAVKNARTATARERVLRFTLRAFLCVAAPKN